jgi:hypothetical protein
MPYRYKPLDQTKREIRILLLYPGERDEPLQGSLSTASLPDNPQYEAVSYLWGDTKDHMAIYLEEKSELRIHRSLHRALGDIRSPTETMILWQMAFA